MRGSTHQVSTVSLHEYQKNLCDALAVVLVLNTVRERGGGLCSVGSGSPSEDWGNWSFHCRNKFYVLQLQIS